MLHLSSLRVPCRLQRHLLSSRGLVPLLLLALAALAGAADASVVAVRHWSYEGVTRIAVEVDGAFTYSSAVLSKPSRVFFDIQGAVPVMNGERLLGQHAIAVDDRIVERVRVALTRPGVTRVVVDLVSDAEFKASRLANPDRLVIDLRLPGQNATAPETLLAESRETKENKQQSGRDSTAAATVPAPAAASPGPAAPPGPEDFPRRPSVLKASREPVELPRESAAVPAVKEPAPAPVSAESAAEPGADTSDTPRRTTASAPEPRPKLRPFVYPEPARKQPGTSKGRTLTQRKQDDPFASFEAIRPPLPSAAQTRPIANPAALVVEKAVAQATANMPAPPVEAPPVLLAKAESKPPVSLLPEKELPPPAETAAALEEKISKPARQTSNGKHSLIRAMGLKLGRVVIDPGHGGHDTGTISRNGLREKDIALDIGKRLGALLEEQLGMEVVYTRQDDTFIPLGDRTRIANSGKADLFVSLHLNASRQSTVAGAETFFLSLTNSQYELDVAAKENANADKSIHDLQDLVQKITLSDKIEESREFALKMQTAMHGHLAETTRARKDRGAKRAPFVVLIGASMPSILVEMGFLSNPREEASFKQAAHRQKVAEALLDGIVAYARGLSHNQVAKTYLETE